MRRGPVEIRIDILNALSIKAMSKPEMSVMANLYIPVLTNHIDFLVERRLVESIPPPKRRTGKLKFFYQITDLGRELKDNIMLLKPLFVSDVPERWNTRREQ